MATNKRITELTELSEADLADDDVLAIVDVSAQETFKVRKSTLASALSGVSSVAATSPIVRDQATGTVTLSLATVPIASGGTGATSAAAARTALGVAADPLTTRGDVIRRGASATERLALGSSGQVLQSDGADVVYGSVPAASVSGTLPLANGGTAATSAAAALASLGADAKYATLGSNSNITALTGLTTDLSIAQGGTGSSSASAARTALGLAIGSAVQAFDAQTLKSDVAADLTAGYSSATEDSGTKTSGTFTPSPDTGNFQHFINGGAHTLGVPAKNCTLVLLQKNNSSAGTLTTSSYTIVDGDDLTTTNGHEFFLYITRYNDGSSTFSALTVKALQ